MYKFHNGMCFAEKSWEIRRHGGMRCPHDGCTFFSHRHGALARHSRGCRFASQSDAPWDLPEDYMMGVEEVAEFAGIPSMSRASRFRDDELDVLNEHPDLRLDQRVDNDDGSARRVRFYIPACSFYMPTCKIIPFYIPLYSFVLIFHAGM